MNLVQLLAGVPFTFYQQFCRILSAPQKMSQLYPLLLFGDGLGIKMSWSMFLTSNMHKLTINERGINMKARIIFTMTLVTSTGKSSKTRLRCSIPTYALQNSQLKMSSKSQISNSTHVFHQQSMKFSAGVRRTSKHNFPSSLVITSCLRCT